MNTSISSPDYPNPYESQTRCFWLITTTEGAVPSIIFTDLEIKRGIDWIYIAREAAVVMQFSGSNLDAPHILAANGTTLGVTFQAFAWYYGLRGFSFLVTFADKNGKINRN